RARSCSHTANRSSPRLGAGSARQPGRAALAAATAARTSSASLPGNSATTSSVLAGLVSRRVRPLLAACHSPLMRLPLRSMKALHERLLIAQNRKSERSARLEGESRYIAEGSGLSYVHERAVLPRLHRTHNRPRQQGSAFEHGDVIDEAVAANANLG